MTTKTTVAIDQEIRKKLKKLAGVLDISQGEVIKQALNVFEKTLLSQIDKKRQLIKESFTKEIDITKILKDATKKVWARDSECKEIQEKLEKGPETIDDFIISHWNSGLG